MIALAQRWSEESGAYLRWLVPASVALHLALFTFAPATRRAPPVARPKLWVELPPPPVPAPVPVPVPARVDDSPKPLARAKSPPAARPTSPQSPPPSTNTAPIDFTSTVFSNDGPGLAIGVSAPPAPPTPQATVAKAPAAAPAPPAPRIVEVASLGRRPKPPALDGELERQYPPDAKRSGISGTAVLRLRIHPDGRAGEVRVVSESWQGFGAACERTVKAGRWDPPLDRDGTPVTTEITYTCRFEVRS